MGSGGAGFAGLGEVYADAVWDADPNDLAQAEPAMALCYANHAHKAPYDRAWVTNERLMQQCKIRSMSTIGRVRDSLVEKRWLIPLHPKAFALSDARGLVGYSAPKARLAASEWAEPAEVVEARVVARLEDVQP
ncbi:hypothetical protein ACFYY8_29580 [Streptosporangium sp. NPDC001559]|uniref:hypothetical protein n=1 Tax=Streptosporangium sp. NPDC001559 TaxID=3366187 RepID=UPI0036F0BB97